MDFEQIKSNNGTRQTLTNIVTLPAIDRYSSHSQKVVPYIKNNNNLIHGDNVVLSYQAHQGYFNQTVSRRNEPHFDIPVQLISLNVLSIIMI